MPTPIGHALGGLVVGLLTGRSETPGQLTRRGRNENLAICAAVACLPDLDFFWGRHNMETHSLGFAILVGLVVLAWRRSGWLAMACTLSVASHVLLDWLGSDDSAPLGVMALWPLSREFFFADAFVFDAVSRRYWVPGFIAHNLLAIAREIAILLPLAAGLWWWRSPREPTTTSRQPT
jgi:inner membrane protein